MKEYLLRLIVKLKIIILLLFLFSTSYANQGRLINLAKDGTLIELPKSYQPAIFDLESKTFQIRGAKVKNFTSCIAKYIPTDKENYELQFSASWKQRENSILPPHITLRIVPLESRFFLYSLSFELDTLKLITASHFVSNSKNGGQLNELKIAKECK